MTFLKVLLKLTLLYISLHAFKEEVEDENGDLREVEMDEAWLSKVFNSDRF